MNRSDMGNQVAMPGMTKKMKGKMPKMPKAPKVKKPPKIKRY